ncbi:uncharacterized protein LJ264_008770 [Porphyrio hochstetteri]
MARRTHIPGSPRRREGAAALPGWGRCGRGFAGASPPSPAGSPAAGPRRGGQGQGVVATVPQRERTGRGGGARSAPTRVFGGAHGQAGGSGAGAARTTLPSRPWSRQSRPRPSRLITACPPAGGGPFPPSIGLRSCPSARGGGGAEGRWWHPAPLLGSPEAALTGRRAEAPRVEAAASRVPDPAWPVPSRLSSAEPVAAAGQAAPAGEGEAEVLTIFPLHLTFLRRRMHPRAETARPAMGKTDPAVVLSCTHPSTGRDLKQSQNASGLAALFNCTKSCSELMMSSVRLA